MFTSRTAIFWITGAWPACNHWNGWFTLQELGNSGSQWTLTATVTHTFNSAETWDELFSEEPVTASSVWSWFPAIEGTFICMADVAVGGFALSGSAALQPSGSARLGVAQRSRDFKLSSLLKERAVGSIAVRSICWGLWKDDKLPFKDESDEDRVSSKERFPPADRDVSSW